jgi:hypothetical protein
METCILERDSHRRITSGLPIIRQTIARTCCRELEGTPTEPLVFHHVLHRSQIASGRFDKSEVENNRRLFYEQVTSPLMNKGLFGRGNIDGGVGQV